MEKFLNLIPEHKQLSILVILSYFSIYIKIIEDNFTYIEKKFLFLDFLFFK